MTYDKYNAEFLAPGGTEVNIIPVMQGDGPMRLAEEELPDKLPILALRNAVLFPGTIYPITIGREKSIRIIKEAEKKGTCIGAVPQLDVSVEDPGEKDLSRYGTVVKIVRTLEMPDGTDKPDLDALFEDILVHITDAGSTSLGNVLHQSLCTHAATVHKDIVGLNDRLRHGSHPVEMREPANHHERFLLRKQFVDVYLAEKSLRGLYGICGHAFQNSK